MQLLLYVPLSYKDKIPDNSTIFIKSGNVFVRCQVYVPVPEHEHPSDIPVIGRRGRPASHDEQDSASPTASAAHQHP